MRILLVEDDAATRARLARDLVADGHALDVARDGDEAVRLGAGVYDVLIVDRMMPRLDGLSAVRRLRAAGVRTPVLFLTNLDGVEDRVAGLDAGGDDYLPKPFAFAELAARLRALARRAPPGAAETVLRVADLELDLLGRRAARAGVALPLQPRELRLLECLMRHADQVVTRAMLLERVWGFHFEPRTSVVETHVSRLRAKVDRPFATPLIATVRGAGYRLGEPG